MQDMIDTQQYQEWLSMLEEPGADFTLSCEDIASSSVWDDSLITSLVTVDEPEFPFVRRTVSGSTSVSSIRSSGRKVRKPGRSSVNS